MLVEGGTEELETMLVGSRPLNLPEIIMRPVSRSAISRMKGGLLAGAALSLATACLDPAAAVAQTSPQAQGDAQEAPPKQVPLTQKNLDGLVNAQKQIRAVEAKATPSKNADEPDAKTEAKIESIAKANGFASMSDFANASYSVGLVLAGMDPETKTC